MRRNVAVLAFAGLAISAVGAGILTIGGPGDARLLRLDRNAVLGLVDLARQLECKAGTPRPERLPDTLSRTDLEKHCPRNARIFVSRHPAWPDRRGARYLRKSDTEFEVCADFHDLARVDLDRARQVDRETGCIAGKLGGR